MDSYDSTGIEFEIRGSYERETGRERATQRGGRRRGDTMYEERREARRIKRLGVFVAKTDCGIQLPLI